MYFEIFRKTLKIPYINKSLHFSHFLNRLEYAISEKDFFRFLTLQEVFGKLSKTEGTKGKNNFASKFKNQYNCTSKI